MHEVYKLALLNEILPKILSKIDDPLQLLRIRLISKDWNKKLMECTNWKSLCLEKIGSLSLDAIIKSTFSHILFNDYGDIIFQDDWKKFFFSHLNWQKFHNESIRILLREFHVKRLNDRFIMNIDVWGNYLAVGSVVDKKVRFCVYDITKSTLVHEHVFDTHDEHLDKLIFWLTACGKLMLICHQSNNFMMIFVVKDDFRILESDIEPSQLCSGTNGSLYIYFSPRSEISKYSYEPASEKLICMATKELRSENYVTIDDDTLIMNSFMSKVFILITSRESINLVIINDELDSENENRYILNVDSVSRWTLDINLVSPFDFILCDISVNNLGIYVFDNILYVTASIEDSIHIIRHNLSGLFETGIKSVLLHGNNFICGLKNGDLHIFYIHDLQNFARYNGFDINRLTRKIIRLNTLNPIEYLKVVEINSQPIIFAATCREIFEIKYDD